MKKIILFLAVISVFLNSCVNIKTKEKSIIASNIFINDIMYNINNIEKYYYNPVEGIYYIYLEMNNEFNKIFDENFEEHPNLSKQYWGDNILKQLILLNNYFGNIIKYELMNIEYNFEMFPFYDYGYPHHITIELLIYYENIVLRKKIWGYYIKEIDKIIIVSMSIGIYN
jgi:hypothetical protein